jgi:hypothetical protein
MRTLDWNSYRAHLRIPECWTCFTFEGIVHELHDGRWRVRPEKWERPANSKTAGNAAAGRQALALLGGMHS